MKLPESMTTGITTSGGVIFRITIGVSGVMLTESTEFRELTDEELDLVAGYGLQLVSAMLADNSGEVARLKNLLQALRAKPKEMPHVRGGHALA